MVGYFTLILVCQLAGELVVGLLGVSVPGPVVGMLLLFILLLVRGQIPEGLARTADGLLNSMSLLFVPAGAGVMMHFQLVGQALMPLSAALIISTSMTIIVTALMMRWLNRTHPDE